MKFKATGIQIIGTKVAFTVGDEGVTSISIEYSRPVAGSVRVILSIEEKGEVVIFLPISHLLVYPIGGL